MSKYPINNELASHFLLNEFKDHSNINNKGEEKPNFSKRLLRVPRKPKRYVIIDGQTLKLAGLLDIERYIIAEQLLACICYQKLPTRSKDLIDRLKRKEDRLDFMIFLIKNGEEDLYLAKTSPWLLKEIKEICATIKL